MADADTHKRIAMSNEQTMNRLLNPNTTGGVRSTADHPWIAVIAYYSAYHLVAEVASIAVPDRQLLTHDEQVDFLRQTPSLQETALLYNNLNTLRKYALYRAPVNASLATERKILFYADAEQFQAVVLDSWFVPLKEKLMDYRHSLLSIKIP